MAGYRAQRRGDRGAYERYLRGMDASMRQKVALTAAHLRSIGTVADMGMGSGAGSEALAALYPALDVVGVDIEPTMVELARERYSLDNLRFVVGDIAERVFEPDSLDGIVDSSVLHHVTSFNGYRSERAADAIRNQVAQLAPRGVLIVRDFVDPGGGTVWLDLPTDQAADSAAEADAPTSADPRTCSPAALFERFAGEYRPLSETPGFAFKKVAADGVRAGWRRYEVEQSIAAEFVLRKDYRADWAAEVKEAYLYFTQSEFEALFASLGLRVLASTPLWNPWIVRNRFRGQFELRSPDGALLEPPPTNYVIVGEKVTEGEGVRFVEAREVAPIGFLHLEYYRHRHTGAVFDLVRRPNRTLDVLPWFELDGDLFVLTRASYPRPILCSRPRGTVSLSGSWTAGYTSEPLLMIQTDRPLGSTVEHLLEESGVAPSAVVGVHDGSTYYPSPGGLQEEVASVFVEVRPTFLERPLRRRRSGFSTSGHLMAVEAQQLLRSAQVGGLPDARLELNAYDLLLAKGRAAGPWLGDAIELTETDADRVQPGAVAEVLGRPLRRVFERAPAEDSPGFLGLHCAEFEERDRDDSVVSRRALEFVVPRPLSHNSVAVAPLCRAAGDVWFGVDDDDLPAAQCFAGNSNLMVAPAWRLPREVTTRSLAWAWIARRLSVEYGVTVGQTWELGGEYRPSLGVTPEVVHPVVVEITGHSASPANSLCWVPLRDLVAERRQLRDGHLRIVALRAAHALGLL